MLMIHSFIPWISFKLIQGMIDLGYFGNPFTCSDKRHGKGNICERLDRCIANKEWNSIFSNAAVTHLPLLPSNHCPIVLNVKVNYFWLPKPFGFKAF